MHDGLMVRLIADVEGPFFRPEYLERSANLPISKYLDGLASSWISDPNTVTRTFTERDCDSSIVPTAEACASAGGISQPRTIAACQ
jgi:hypothetical protein